MRFGVRDKDHCDSREEVWPGALLSAWPQHWAERVAQVWGAGMISRNRIWMA